MPTDREWNLLTEDINRQVGVIRSRQATLLICSALQFDTPSLLEVGEFYQAHFDDFPPKGLYDWNVRSAQARGLPTPSPEDARQSNLAWRYAKDLEHASELVGQGALMHIGEMAHDLTRNLYYLDRLLRVQAQFDNSYYWQYSCLSSIEKNKQLSDLFSHLPEQMPNMPPMRQIHCPDQGTWQWKEVSESEITTNEQRAKALIAHSKLTPYAAAGLNRVLTHFLGRGIVSAEDTPWKEILGLYPGNEGVFGRRERVLLIERGMILHEEKSQHESKKDDIRLRQQLAAGLKKPQLTHESDIIKWKQMVECLEQDFISG